MRKLLLATAAVLAISTLAATPSAAQDERDLSGDRVFCDIVETAGNNPAMNARILADVNRDYAGRTERISRRKSFVLERATEITFSGCTMRMRFDAKMKRRIRRDAVGTVDVVATMRNFRFGSASNPGRACVKDAEIDDVSLSNTLRVGEFFYRKVGNWFMEKPTCFDLRRA